MEVHSPGGKPSPAAEPKVSADPFWGDPATPPFRGRGGPVSRDGLRAERESPGTRHGVSSHDYQVLDARRDTSGGYKVDVSRGQRVGRVSSEWFSPR
jgi:hypothetical protein